jgi:proteasome accessory factor C
MYDLTHLDKLIALYRLMLLSKYPVKLNKICDELDCNRSTFFRLKEDFFKHYGSEIVFNKKLRGYEAEKINGILNPIPGLLFKEGEIEALFCFEHIAESLQEGFISDIFKPFRDKIESLIKSHDIATKNWRNRIKIIRIASRKILPSIYKTVASAVLHRKKIKIVYQSVQDDTAMARVVSPQTLLCYRDNWYLDAFCHSKKDLRTFGLSRIISATQLNEKAIDIPFEKLKEHYANSYGIFSGPAQNTAKVKFTGAAARIVAQEEWHPQQKGLKTIDGSYLLELPYSKGDELLMDILRWGEEAEVLEPKELRLEIENKINKIKKVYVSRMK